jgi:hypothetical protein
MIGPGAERAQPTAALQGVAKAESTPAISAITRAIRLRPAKTNVFTVIANLVQPKPIHTPKK